MAVTRGGSSGTTTLPGPGAGGPIDVPRDRKVRAPVLAPVRGRRRPGLLAAGLMLTAMGALVAVWLVNGAGHRVPVLIVTRPVAMGSTITAADVGRAEVSVDTGVGTVPAAQESAVVGRVAAAGLVAGQMLAPGLVTDAGPPAVGQVLVVLSLPAARLPAGGLHPGDRILVVNTPPADAEPPTSVPASIPATVVRQGAPDLNGVRAVDVTTATGDGPSLAATAATGRIAVIVQPRRQG